MKTKILSFLVILMFSVSAIADELVDLSVEQVSAMQQSNEALIIDIRTEQEWEATGTIPSSHKLEFFNREGKYDAERWLAELERLKSSPDQPVVLVCRSGNRSGMVGNFLTQQVGMKNVYHLSSGLTSWIRAGLKVENNCSNQLACK